MTDKGKEDLGGWVPDEEAMLGAIGKSEDLSDIINDISPMDSPFIKTGEAVQKLPWHVRFRFRIDDWIHRQRIRLADWIYPDYD